MNSIGHRPSKRKSCAAVLYAAAFLFFLVYTTPHRVHHLFEQVSPADQQHADDHHKHSGHQNKSANESDCVFQTSVNRCAFGLTPLFQPLTLAHLIQDVVDFPDTNRPQQFLSAPFQIRAPPKA
jgi:hypothetical protein